MSNRNWPLGRALVAALLVVGALRADDRITWTELPAAKVLTRFPPGVVYEAGAWKGWYDVTKLGNVSTTQWGEVNDWGYCWAFSAVNMAAWWLDRYRAAGGEVNATLSPTADTYLNGTSKYGYQAALADAIPDYWEPKGGNSSNCLSWLFTGEAIEYTGDSLAKLRVKPSGGFFRELIPESAVPDFSCYFRRELEVSDFTPWGTDEESVLFYFSDILFQMLARGPAAVEIPTHAFTLWGAEFKEATYNGATRWKVTKVYVADNDRGETEGTAPQLLSLDVTVMKPPMLSTKTPTITGYKASAYIYRLVPLYGYKADGLPDPEPDPEPEPTPDPEPEPTPDPEPGAPIVPPAANPRPRPPEGDTGAFHPEVRDHLSTVAREAGFTADFGVRFRRGQGPAEEPSVVEVNSLMRCFKGLNFEADPAAGVMTLDYDFRVSTLAFVTVADEPYVVVGVVVESGGREAAFGEAAQFALNARGAMNARATTQAGAVEVTDATGQTEGRSAAEGRRYFRLPLAETGTSGFFFVSVFSEEASE